jgi:peptide/nickel transport system substrate-binding protein
MKKWSISIIVILILSSIMIGCSSQSTTTPPSNPAPTTTAAVATTTAPKPTITATAGPVTTAPVVTSVIPTITRPAIVTTAPSGVKYGGNLRIILTGPVAAIGTLGAPTEYISGMYGRVAAPAIEFLFTYDANEKFFPQLAESWEISPDGKTLIIRIRKGVKFTDGTDLNAQAVKEDFDLMKVATNIPGWLTMFKNVASYNVVDDYTLKVTFSTPDSLFMVNMSLYGLMSPTAMKKPTSPTAMAKDHMVGTGPFKFVNYTRGDFIQYTKNENYWQTGKPYVDTMELRQIDDPVTSTIYFRTGAGQLIFGITPKDAPVLEQLGYRILKSSANNIIPIVPDGANKDSPFANIKVRQAVEYAIDRKALATIGLGYWQPAFQMAVPSDSRYVPELAARNYDVAKARQLLTEAGYPDGFKTTLVANNTFDRNVLVGVQAYLKAAGIDGTIDIQEAAKFTDTQNKGWKGLLFSGTPIVGNVQSMWNRFGAQIYPSMYRGTFQQKLDAAITEMDYDKRLGNLKDMVRVMYDDAMVIPIYASPDLSAADKSLQGDINWTIGHPNMWAPANAWLSP